MSEFESLLDCSPYLASEAARGKKLPSSPAFAFVGPQPVEPEKAAPEQPGLSPGDCNRLGALGCPEPAGRQMQRSYTAPDKTGIRVYYSPPVARRLGVPVVHDREGKIIIEPGFLFTTAKPKESAEADRLAESSYSRWLCNFSRQRLDGGSGSGPSAPGPTFPAALHDFEMSGNMSDDMKEITNCVRQAMRSGSLERKVKSTSSQTVGLASVGTQTIRTVSVGLQTDPPRSSLHGKSWSPRSSSLVSVRSKQIASSLDKVHSRIERPCCSPKYGSPKLQRRSVSKLDGAKDRSLWNLHQGKQNGSAWARSTTTRDSPVLRNINDGLSSLFSVVEHSGSTESVWKLGMSEARAKPEPPKYGIVQEFFRNVCGRAPSPTATPGEEGPKKPEPLSPASYHQPEGVARIVNKKAAKPGSSEEARLSVLPQVGKDGVPRDGDGTTVLLSEVGGVCPFSWKVRLPYKFSLVFKLRSVVCVSERLCAGLRWGSEGPRPGTADLRDTWSERKRLVSVASPVALPPHPRDCQHPIQGRGMHTARPPPGGVRSQLLWSVTANHVHPCVQRCHLSTLRLATVGEFTLKIANAENQGFPSHSWKCSY